MTDAALIEIRRRLTITHRRRRDHSGWAAVSNTVDQAGAPARHPAAARTEARLERHGGSALGMPHEVGSPEPILAARQEITTMALT